MAAIDCSEYLYSKSTHYISNSGSDENGKYTGGTAGDQTGKEWQLKAWYNRPWTVVLRYPNYAVGLKIAQLGIAAALNNKIGYDQNQRTTYWTQLKAAGYDPSKINTPCEEDCTAGVSSNVRAAGYIFGIKALQNVPICSSRNMRAEFTKAGFKALTASKYLTGTSYLLPGDILLYESHHAATNITVGSKAVEPSIDETIVQLGPDAYDQNVPAIVGYVVVSGNYHIRQEPSASSESIGIVKSGTKVPYLGINQNGWNQVYYNDQIAWISGKAGYIEERTVTLLTITKGTWNVRTEGNTNGSKIGAVKPGDQLAQTGPAINGWYPVEFNGQNGWVSGKAFANN